jgi:hemerythrin
MTKVIDMLKLDPISKFKDDHRKVRDMLFELIDAISRRDSQKALKILSDLDRFVGPHFRWEEESLYLMFEKFFGREYLEYLLGVHDRIVKRAKELVEILSKGRLQMNKLKSL